MQNCDTNISQLERDFINHFQGEFPLQIRPFLAASEKLGCDEDELIATVIRLKEKKILTRFGPLFDAAELGGGLTLAAISVPEKNYDHITELVNSYPEVAHNYRREHELNMWFVLATETPQQLTQTISSIEQASGLPVFNFPKLQEFYIGLWLHLSADGNNTTVSVPVHDRSLAVSHVENDYRLDDIDRKLVSACQKGFSVIQEPYQEIADAIGISPEEVLTRFKHLLDRGIIRRIGAVPNHYKLGIIANGMTVWDVDDNKIDQLGDTIGQLDFVSHCYQRPRHLPLWPYNLFAMVHGTSKNEVDKKASLIAEQLGDDCNTHEILFSSAILKKTGLRLPVKALAA